MIKTLPAPKVHLGNLEFLIEAIEKAPPKRFNMNWYIFHVPANTWHRCQTEACIAGHFILAAPKKVQDEWIDFYKRGRPHITYGRHSWLNAVAGAFTEKHLNLTKPQRNMLFAPGSELYAPLCKVERKHALRVLRHLRDHLEINWSVANEPQSAYEPHRPYRFGR